jgi:hypothetical protein
VFGVLAVFDGETFRPAAARNISARLAGYLSATPPNTGLVSQTWRMIAGELVAHAIDLKDNQLYRSGVPYPSSARWLSSVEHALKRRSRCARKRRRWA